MLKRLLSEDLLNNEKISCDICETVAERFLPKKKWVSWAERKSVPKEPGLYIISNEDKIVYIGETSNIHERLTHHENDNGSALKDKIQDHTGYDPVTYLKSCKLKVIPVKFGRLEIEKFLIRKYNPIFNNYKLRRRYNKD